MDNTNDCHAWLFPGKKCCKSEPLVVLSSLTAATPTVLQVESLRQLGDAAGNQLGATQARLEQLQADKEQQEQQMRTQLQAVQVSRAFNNAAACRR